MPTYDFKCTSCDTVFEIERPMGATDAVGCPACGADTKRVFTPVGVAFKGTGFHNTDYRPRPAEKTSDAPSCASAGSSSG
jgi:putative FmdB family regulatory protein